MEKIKKTTRKQHYIPQFYLRQWVDEDGCFYPVKIEDRTPPKLGIFEDKSSPTRFCYENFFYAQYTGKEDDISQVLEKGFAEIEGIFSKKLPELEAKILNNQQITDEDKYHLSEFMIFIWLKGKAYREHSQRMSEKVYKEINRHTVHYMDKNPQTKAKMEKLGITKDQMVDFVEKGEYHVEFGNMYHMSLFKDMPGFCNLLSAKFWKVYISRKGEFITSDAPYSDAPTSHNTFWGNDFLSREQSFVLSPKVVIVARYPKNENGKNFSRKDITENKVVIQTLNSYRAMNSIRFAFHKDRGLLEELQKYAIVIHQFELENSKTSDEGYKQ